MKELVLDQQFVFVYFLGPWLTVYVAVALVGGVIEGLISLLGKRILLVRIVKQDEE